MGEIIHAGSYDFTKYKAGDVIVFRMSDASDRSTFNRMTDLVARIKVECRRRGIAWKMTSDDARDEVRIELL